MKDEKYNIDGFYYSDPRMDYLGFFNNRKNTWMLNSLAMPITDVGKIVIKAWNDDTIIEMNDFQSLYYSRKLSTYDRDYLTKFFSQNTLDNIMIKKYCKPISVNTIFKALSNIGLSNIMLKQLQKLYYLRKPMFISDVTTKKFQNEREK